MSGRLHDDELEISDDLVRALLGTLSPAYASLALRRLSRTGSDNALFRLGDDLVVRLPRQPGGGAAIAKEARWSPFVAPALPVALPEVVAVGKPGFGYPERWSIVRWLEGSSPVVPSQAEPPRHDLARDLGAVVTALRHLPVPREAVDDPALHWYRCDPLSGLDHEMRRVLEELRDVPGVAIEVEACAALWDETMRLDGTPPAPTWMHADLLGENLLVRDGRLTAVLDLGGLAVGDPTVDLVAAWELLDPEARATFRASVGVDDVTWDLARGWALALALMAIPYYWDSMPARCASRLAMLRQVLADAARS